MNNKKDYNCIMVDLETLGTSPGAVILSIGAVAFNMETGKTREQFYEKVAIQSCLDFGLKINGETLRWWLIQSDEARKELTTGYQIPLNHAINAFTEFVDNVSSESTEMVTLWGNSARFDLGILVAGYEAAKLSIPWKREQERDVRTLVGFASHIKANQPRNQSEAHLPIADCKHQIAYCSATWNYIIGNKTK